MIVATDLRSASSTLAPISDAPRLDAERLMLLVTGRSETGWLYAHGDQALPSEQRIQFGSLVRRRATGEPLAYILGQWEFYGRPFFVTPDVLIPRPATEQLVPKALLYIENWMAENTRPMVIADIGSGSGCVAITLACEMVQLKRQDSPHFAVAARDRKFKILATDISPAALAVARRNAERHGVSDQIEFIEGDMLAPMAGRQIDLIVSNPPYVPTAELARSGGARDTRGLTFEPAVALDGGGDGQRFVNQIKNAGVPALVETSNGNILELGLRQTSPVSRE